MAAQFLVQVPKEVEGDRPRCGAQGTDSADDALTTR